jgi:hypothetical protein
VSKKEQTSRPQALSCFRKLTKSCRPLHAFRRSIVVESAIPEIIRKFDAASHTKKNSVSEQKGIIHYPTTATDITIAGIALLS